MTEPLEFLSLDEIKTLPLNLDGEGVALLHSLLNEGLYRAYNRAIESALLSMPHYAALLLRRSADMEAMRSRFLSAHQDLAKSVEFAESLAELEQEHPGWAYDKVLEEAAVRTRNRLRVKAIEGELSRSEVQKITPTDADNILNGAL